MFWIITRRGALKISAYSAELDRESNTFTSALFGREANYTRAHIGGAQLLESHIGAQNMHSALSTHMHCTKFLLLCYGKTVSFSLSLARSPCNAENYLDRRSDPTKPIWNIRPGHFHSSGAQ